MTNELSASCIINGSESCGVCFRSNGRCPESTESQAVVIPTVDTVTPGINVVYPRPEILPEPSADVCKFPVIDRLRAQIDDCKKQVGKLNTKRDMLLRQIETLEDAVRELEAKGTQ